MVAVEGNIRIGAHTLQTEEILLSGNDCRQREFLADRTLSVKVAVFLLQRSVIVVEVKGHIAAKSLAVEGHFPIIIQRNVLPVTGRFGNREVHLTLSHEAVGGDGNAALSAVVHRAIEMKHSVVPVHHITLMGEHLVVGLGRDNKVGTRPVLPVHKVATYRKCIEGIVFARRVEGREIEHDKDRCLRFLAKHTGGHLHYLCIACDGAIGVVRKHRVSLIAFPVLQILTQCYADALALGMGGILAAGIVVHHIGRAEIFLGHAVDGALVLCELFPPLGILLIVGKDWFLLTLPNICIIYRRCMGQADAERSVHGFVTSTWTTDIGHPILVLIRLNFITSTPLIVNQCRKTATLVLVPSLSLRERQGTA